MEIFIIFFVTILSFFVFTIGKRIVTLYRKYNSLQKQGVDINCREEVEEVVVIEDIDIVEVKEDDIPKRTRKR